eukprot:TRINITY_DN70311_c0_g1_i1.p1 TRINITY_DN70311_c0_g1~~TRINITY_DN70311_c0_g1_i1.p1  ORF type:complete len:129 (+),score=39.74 TRINITY_DN70311_c0_g1_i1:18-404(+)
MSAMTDPRLKQIRIKTGVLRRLGKEKLSYKKEADIQMARVEKMKKEGRDEYDIMKMGLVVQESLGMIPHCHRRLVAAHDDLADVLEANSDLVDEIEEEKTEEQKQYEAAVEQLKQAEEQIKAAELEEM